MTLARSMSLCNPSSVRSNMWRDTSRDLPATCPIFQQRVAGLIAFMIIKTGMHPVQLLLFPGINKGDCCETIAERRV